MVENANVSQDVMDQFAKLKGNQSSFMVCKIQGSDILLESAGEKDAPFDQFAAALPESEARFGIVDFKFDTGDGRHVSKIVFVVYVPDTCTSMQEKFAYANFKGCFKQKLNPVHKEMQINDRADLTFDEFKDQFN